ncbi:related to mitochondrial import receptor subunit TOM20 [Melanopsichium pennsylvanicum]|uniref:Mitochondrial import receptor subunit TOM20 n=2 Tax=Melanopsichium pennsylvanicum TaxID=63383 RepID=A0AAJ4XHE8_9BASI|nr:related to mitochondrial import receptor subunit TOM20 [Melanopsichium pennsylvanicum 4]SNX82599.1 related to mitochondrial import receptor subunit TOM20 [Melanopsichium pennsylvanicum]
MKTSQIVLTSLSALGIAGVGYAIYFDHRRRNDPVFRKSLRKESKKSSKAEKKAAAQRSQQEDVFIQELLQEVRAPGTFPAGVEEREQYFLKYVSLGEQLFAMGTDKYLDAAAAFFRALKVYPQPVELIMIYQKAVPKEVFDTIMRIVSKDVATGGGEGSEAGMSAAGLDDVDEDGPSPLSAAKADAENEDEEQEDVENSKKQQNAAEEKQSSPSSSASAAQLAAAPAQGTDSGTTSSQEWDTLSATSLNETGVMVTPNAPASTSSQSPDESATPSAAAEEAAAAGSGSTDEPKLTAIDTSAAVTAAPSTPSKQNLTSGAWSPAPIFSASSPRAENKSTVDVEEDKSE